MGNLLAVAAFGRPFVAIAEVEFLLLAVEVWTNAVFVTLGAEESPATQRLEAEHREQMQAWLDSDRRREADMPGAIGGPLMMEGVSLDDGKGTVFEHRGGSAGGTGTEWRVEQMLSPGPAHSARRLTVSPADIGTPLGTYQVDLRPSA